MSGTSLDGVDAALVAFDDETPSLVSTYFEPYPEKLFTALKEACQASQLSFEKLGTLDATLGDFYAHCVQQLLLNSTLSASNVVAIGSHGQTIQHSPNSTPPFTLQIGDANRIAANTGITVIADFRRKDMAAGGQGAPLVPAFHQSVFRSDEADTAILNIGGIANLTFLSEHLAEPVIGFDCGPGNTLMDQWCQRHFDTPYDKAGNLANKGHLNKPLLDSLLSDRYFSQPYPKSTGPELFNMQWLDSHLSKNPTNELDTLTTLCELTVASIALGLKQLPNVDQVLICGGGVHNLFLKNRLEHQLGYLVDTTERMGIHPDWVEAMAFAWLAKQTLEGKPGNLPSVTGANKAVVLGAIYPA